MKFYVALQTVPGIRWYNLIEFLYEENCKIEKEMYVDILRRLRDGGQ